MEPNFVQSLVEKLKAAGLPLLETQVEALFAVLSEHVKSWKYEQPIVGAIAPAAMFALDSVVKEAIDKIDGVEG